MISANGLNIHIAEKGKGPLVLFLQGFPKLWYSWRHQIHLMASHGYHAVAPDLRGYGDTTGAPVDDPSNFSLLHIAGDIVALLDVIAPKEKVFVVAHDWGAYIAWHLSLFRPDKVKALVSLSIHYLARNPMEDIVKLMEAAYGEEHYMVRFQDSEVSLLSLLVASFNFFSSFSAAELTSVKFINKNIEFISFVNCNPIDLKLYNSWT